MKDILISSGWNVFPGPVFAYIRKKTVVHVSITPRMTYLRFFIIKAKTTDFISELFPLFVAHDPEPFFAPHSVQ